MEIRKRPALKLKKKPVENVLNIISLLVYIGSVIHLFMHWSSLPNRVPIHYNLVGEVDKWGSKEDIFFLPITGAILWIGLTILEKFPHIYNYTVTLTEENIEQQYKNGRTMINVVKNEIFIYMAYCNWKDVNVAYGHHVLLDNRDSLIFLIILFGSMAFFIIKSFRLQ
ncbi:MAG: DUF1648 domain-containing protein [Bacillales bacterium]|nr:DUF1648 domain-containing protein [Bacillales bacterium]